MILSDDSLILRIKTRDLNAFRILVRRYIDRTYAIAFCILGTEPKADDTIQRMFLELWRRPAHFLYGSGPLVIRLFKQTIAFSRAAQNRDARSTSDYIVPIATNEHFSSVQLVHGALVCLPIDERLILLLSRSEELSAADIANIVRVDTPAVISTLMKNQRHVRQLLRARNVALH